ncbi:topology modulation protein [Actinoplanes sp. NBC_00393]|uniref:topology modulation protein n=1 Tax=Actinoplanes sp. NBC_00393 TaxID=2975953 RepID=UPI002E1E313D
MDRIAIIGCGGSGKTVLARRLATRLGLTVNNLDALYYDDGWNPVLYLDLPAWTCLWGITQRRLRYRGGQHADGGHDRITWSFIKYAIGYRHSMRPRVNSLVAEHGKHPRCVRLTSRRQANRFTDRLDVPPT